MHPTAELRMITAAGAPREIGRRLGETGLEAARGVLLESPYWAAVTRQSHRATVARLGAATRLRFPAIWEELQGLAEGLDLPFDDVLAWNCRGDLLANTADGCTTVQLPGPEPRIAHNEDGLPGFRGYAFLAEVQPDGAPGFTSFCYPGSLPGHAFAATQAGLAQAVNNIRLTGFEPQIPRMVLGRAVLNCGTLEQAVAQLQDNPHSGGFHMTLAQAGDVRLFSVEFGAGASALREISSASLHANHALHLAAPQVVTSSSSDRQSTGEALLSAHPEEPSAILRNTDGPGFPIFRTAPDDPDDENTLATALLNVCSDHVELDVIDQIGQRMRHVIRRTWKV